MSALIINMILLIIAIFHSPIFLFLVPVSASALTIALLPWFKGSFTKRSVKAASFASAAASVLFIAGYWFEVLTTYYYYR